MSAAAAVVRLKALDGTWEVAGADRYPNIVPESLNIDYNAWGADRASFALKRAAGIVYPDLLAGTPVEIEIGGKHVWTGRIAETPSQEGGESVINVAAEGGQYYLDDAKVYNTLTLTAAEVFDMRSLATHNPTQYTPAGQMTFEDGTLQLGWGDGTYVATDYIAGVWSLPEPIPQKDILGFDGVVHHSNNSPSVNWMIVMYSHPDPFKAVLGAITVNSGTFAGKANPFFISHDPATTWYNTERMVTIGSIAFFVYTTIARTALTADIWAKFFDFQLQVKGHGSRRKFASNLQIQRPASLRASTIIEEGVKAGTGNVKVGAKYTPMTRYDDHVYAIGAHEDVGTQGGFHHWPLNDAGPTTLTDLRDSRWLEALGGAGENLVFSGAGAATFQQTSPFAASRPGDTWEKSITIGSANHWFQASNAGKFASSNLTMCGWVYPTAAVGGRQYGIAVKSNAYGMWNMDGNLKAYDWGGGTGWKDSGFALPLNTWSFVAFRSGGFLAAGSLDLQLTVNTQHSALMVMQVLNQASLFMLGSNNGAANCNFVGSLANFSWFDWYLSNEQLDELYEAGRCALEAGKIHRSVFPISEYAPYEPRTPREHAEAANAYHDWKLMVNQDLELVYEPKASAPVLEAGAYSGFNFQDASANSLADITNAAQVGANRNDGLRLNNLRESEWFRSESQLTNASADDGQNPAIPSANWAAEPPWGTFTMQSYLSASAHSAPSHFQLANGVAGATGAVSTTAVTRQPAVGRRYKLTWRMKGVNLGDATNVWPRFYVEYDGEKISEVCYKPSLLGTTAWQPGELTFVVPKTGSFKLVVKAAPLAPGVCLHLDTFELWEHRDIASRQGIWKAKDLPLSQSATDFTAQHLGDIYLTGNSATPLRGELTAQGPVGIRKVLTGEDVEAYELGLYVNELLRLGHQIDPDTGGLGRDGRITAVSYSHADATARVSLDNTRRNFEVLLERLAHVSGRGG